MDELLIAWGVREVVRDNAVVVTSELVTNALTHSASDWIVCEVRNTDDVLRIEVEDQNRGSTLPVPGRPGPDDQGGRGLLLVAVLSSDWGTADIPHRSGRIVWAELATDADKPVPP
ncbi:ATP-binding protein [Streptomyces sp. W16]|uniref:ATP-binding protein n=1 Tax=Streptomyces sp. W16 TaxID=3076631 RepID=UPI003FA3CDF6